MTQHNQSHAPVQKRYSWGPTDDTLPDRTGMRLHGAGFQETCHLRDFDWSASDRRMLDAALSLAFMPMNEHVLLLRTAGAGRSSLAQAWATPPSGRGTQSTSSMPTIT